ncbi:MAG TPA: response regulator [Alphaproteobacteria bacterium]|nr:response regulator [Alphaproteobacteria bacterium]
MHSSHQRDSILLVEDFPGAARQIVESIGREYDIVHTGAFDMARKLIAHIRFDHYIFDIDFPDTYAEWLQFIHEAIELRVDPSYIASKYYNYGNGLRLFEIVRQRWGDHVHVLFQSGSVWGSYEAAVQRMQVQCPNISFLNKSPFLQEPLHYFRLSLPGSPPR